MKHLISILLLALSYSFATDVAGSEAPLGYKWGQKYPTSKCLVVTDLTGGLSVCKVTSVPKPIKGIGFAMLLLHKGALVKVSVFFKDITSDPYGVKGKESYGKLKEVLTKKYGEPADTYEFTGRELYDEGSEFYQCLAYTGCGAYIAMWGVDGEGQVALQMEGKGRGTGYLKLVYESAMFYKAVDARDEEEEKEAEDNL